MIALMPTTSTGQSNILTGGPFSKVAIEVLDGPGTVTVEGRIGSAWEDLIASSTFPAGGYTATASTGFLVSSVRANVTANGSTGGITVHLLGA